jgi:hypothetical protein
MRTLFLLLFPLLLWARLGFAQSSEEGLHLVVGYALGQLELEGGRFKEETFLSTGFATAAVYHFHPFAVGVKSIAGIGAHDHSEDMALSNSDVPLRRYIQHVSISPYLGYRHSFGKPSSFGLQLEMGPVSAISSLKHKDGYQDDKGLVRKKSSFESKGIEVGIGLYQSLKSNSGDFTVMFNYQALESERQYLVDVTEFKNALTISQIRSRDMEAIETYSLVVSFYLF